MATQAGTVEVVMPAMGDSVAEGTVLEWRKNEGDEVVAEETIVEISTDKVDAEVPAPVGGRIAKIHAAAGDTITVGSVLAEIVTENGDGAAPSTPQGPSDSEVPAPSGAEAPADAEIPEAAEQEPADASAPAQTKTVDIVTPAGGESVTEGTVLEWSVKAGDPVADGDTVVVISTDKVDMELPAPASGTISEILVDEGATVTVGQVIARMTVDAAQSRP